ncbi:MCP four helix bundle domain-containing protein [Undibacterium sp. LX40W]|uniref:MCP four helix bundle domain-containing protein n=2 Tax=Oxalobacteraceae TaxID=75682 RepID=A0A923KVR1_9BURK|nr:MCP four helix bundle domain-containing protein [Undibacterium nitidum]MBC3893679.1 MCP four helix bundle domain-containing protein [Undibacterium sp. LX40W]
MKVGKRLGLGFALVFVLLIAVTALGISGMSLIQDRLENIVNVSNKQGRMILDMRAIVYDRQVSLRNLTLLTDLDDMAKDLKKIEKQSKDYSELEGKLLDSLKKDPNFSKEEKDLLVKLKEKEKAAEPLPNLAKDLGLANNQEMATISLIKKIRPVQDAWLNVLDEMVTHGDKQSVAVADEAKSAFSYARNLLLILGCAALVLGIVAAIFITRSLLKQLGGEPDYAAEIASKIASGDLSGVIDSENGDNDSLIHEMKTMRDSLVNIVGQVRVGTDTIATASREIASGNLDLSSRTEQQASSLEKTTASMKELTTTVKQNADNAREANKLAASASDVARQGGVVVAEVVDTMSSINESAKKIVDIISVIDGIAFQTNILALNAAVEAARAGEQGRGFAVVASEVRSLAQRSAAAAKEIKTLIGDSVEKVEIGSKLVGQAGATIDEVVSSVRHVTDIIAEISAASQEQSTGIEAVNLAIIEMDGMTQQNAALVEEAAAAAQSLQDQAGELAKVVSIFKLNVGEQSMFAPRQSAAAKPAPQAAKPQVKSSVKSLPSAKPAPKKASPAKASDDDWEEF